MAQQKMAKEKIEKISAFLNKYKSEVGDIYYTFLYHPNWYPSLVQYKLLAEVMFKAIEIYKQLPAKDKKSFERSFATHLESEKLPFIHNKRSLVAEAHAYYAAFDSILRWTMKRQREPIE